MAALLERDAATGATYFAVTAHPVARTVHVSDLIMVDVDEQGAPVGVEFAMDARHLDDGDVGALISRFPALVVEAAREYFAGSAAVTFFNDSLAAERYTVAVAS